MYYNFCKKQMIVIIGLIFAVLFFSKMLINAENVAYIPLDVLWGNALYTSPRISPDGNLIAYIGPWNGVLNIWIRPATDFKAEPLLLTHGLKRNISHCYWSSDGKYILYLQDVNGDEQWRLYGVDVVTKEELCFTPAGTRIKLWHIPKEFPDEVIALLDTQNHKNDYKLYTLKLSAGTLELIVETSHTIVDFVADSHGNPYTLLTNEPDGTSKLLHYKEHAWHVVKVWSAEDAPQINVLSYADDYSIYLIDIWRDNTTALKKINVESGAEEVIAYDNRYDISSVWFDRGTRIAKAVNFEKDHFVWQLLDEDFKKIFAQLEKIDKGQLFIIDCDKAQKKYIVAFISDINPATYYLFDITTQKATFLFDYNPALKNYTLASVNSIHIMSRDGLQLEGYITLPVGQTRNVPCVVYVHGGPYSRDSWSYNSVVQWLANRGYAVLQINYRGSRGYGKAFERAGDHEWGGKMHDDLIDGLAWAIDAKIVDPGRVAIFGASYGGYAALVGATFTPDLFTCAIDLFGPSNLVSLVNPFPSFWKDTAAQWYRRIGYPHEIEFLKSRSPLFKLDALRVPLFIAHGAHDQRVLRTESEQLVDALKSKNVPYTFLFFDDEGHGLTKPDNKLKLYSAIEDFLEEHLKKREQNAQALEVESKIVSY